MGWTTLLLLGLAGIGAAALVSYLLWPTKEVEDSICTLRCPGCGRKLRYRASRAGHHGKCPVCKMRFEYPPAPPVEENA